MAPIVLTPVAKLAIGIAAAALAAAFTPKKVSIDISF